jgi:acyl CoA:acetate/3-ketoacid CoA transferase
MPFLGFSPWLQKLVTDDRIEFYGWPIGISAYWFREIASGRPGVLTKIGIGTFLDPKNDGGALNTSARNKMTCKINTIKIEGHEYLLYQAPKPDYALIRATTADESGNLSMEDEGIRGTVLGISQATKARPHQGVVFAQTKRLVNAFSINPRKVEVPGPLVDYVILSPQQYHWQSGTIDYDPRISHRFVPQITKRLTKDIPAKPIVQFEKVIARRILFELIKLYKAKGSPVLVSLGIGIPALVSTVAFEEELTDFIVTVIESNFEGGIIDVASLGFLQVDRFGNVNPSILSDKLFGPGGFPVIAGGAPKTYFAGAFTAGPKLINVVENKLSIVRDGTPKFVDDVYKIIFSGPEALNNEKEILYVTERAVFKLTKKGITLEEISPGVDVDKDILSKMEFCPIVSSSLKQMDDRLFVEGKVNLGNEIL